MPNLEPLNPYSFFSPAIAGSPELQRKFAADRKPLEGAFSPPAFSQFPYFYSRMPPESFTATPSEITAPPRPDYSGFQPVPIPKTTLKDDSSSSGFLDFLGTAFPILSTLGLVDKILGSPIANAVGGLFGSKSPTGGGGSNIGGKIAETAGSSAIQQAIDALIAQGASPSTAQLIAKFIDPKLAAAGITGPFNADINTTHPGIQDEFLELAKSLGLDPSNLPIGGEGAGGFPEFDFGGLDPFGGEGAGGFPEFGVGGESALGLEGDLASKIGNFFGVGSTGPLAFASALGIPISIFLGSLPFIGQRAKIEKAKDAKFKAAYQAEINANPQAWADRWAVRFPDTPGVGPQMRQAAHEALAGTLTMERLRELTGAPNLTLSGWAGGLDGGRISPLAIEANATQIFETLDDLYREKNGLPPRHPEGQGALQSGDTKIDEETGQTLIWDDTGDQGRWKPMINERRDE